MGVVPYELLGFVCIFVEGGADDGIQNALQNLR